MKVHTVYLIQKFFEKDLKTEFLKPVDLISKALHLLSLAGFSHLPSHLINAAANLLCLTAKR